MTATATATATRPAWATKPAAPAVRPHAAPAQPPTRAQELEWLETLSSTLDHAANTDEPASWTGESDRLLSVAHELADHLHVHPDQPGSCGSVQNRAITIAALIKAALQVPGDVPSPERLALIDQARPALVGLTEYPAVLDGWETYVPPKRTAEPSAKSADNRPADQREAMRAICAHVSHAEAVASMVADNCDSDLAWGVIYALRSLCSRLAGMEQLADYGKGHRSVFADAYCEICAFLEMLKCVNRSAKIDLFDAVATLVDAGGHEADKMVDTLAAQASEARDA